MHARNPILKHPFVRDGQRYPVLAAVLRGLLEIPNVPVAGIYRYLQNLPAEKLERLALRIARTQRGFRKARAFRAMQAVLDEADWSSLWEANCRHVALTVSETIRWEQMPVAEAVTGVTVNGAENLHAALAGRRGVMLWGAHLGNLFTLPLAAKKLDIGLCITGNAMPVRSIERRVEDFLEKCGVQYVLIGDSIPALASRTFRRGAALVTYVDFTLPETRNVWVRFGNAETHVSLGPALLALRHRVPVICVTSARLDVNRHEVTFHPPLPVERTGDSRAAARELTQQAMHLIVAGIRQRPEQWWQWDVVPLR